MKEECLLCLVNPGMHTPPAASRVNHITDDMVEEAPKLEEVLGDFLEFVGTALPYKVYLCNHFLSGRPKHALFPDE